MLLRKDYEKQKLNETQPTTRALLEPKVIGVNGYRFVISKMPCTVAQEVLFCLPTGLMPMVKNYGKSEEMALKMLSYCERCYEGNPNVPLISKTIIDNNVPDFDTLFKLEQACVAYNYDFFQNGKVWDFLNKAVSLAESKASAILTDLLDRLLQAGTQH